MSVSGQKPQLTKDVKSIICKTDNFVPLVVPGLSANSGGVSSFTSPPQDSSRREVEIATRNSERSASSSSSGPVSERSDEMAPGTRCDHSKTQNKNKKRDVKENSDNPVADLPEWLEEFKEDLVDTELHASAHSSQDSDSRHHTKVATKSRKHSIYSHFPKDWNCEVCLRTKMTRAPCRRRTGEALPRAGKFGDLITVGDKVLNEGCESRDIHRYAVVEQDLATQWIQSYPCKTKTSHETERSLSKFLEPSHKPRVVHTNNSMKFWKACEDLSWNHHKTNGIAERAVRRVKKGSSAVLLQSGLDERRWWSDSMECYCYLRIVQDILAEGKTPYERRFGEPFK